MVNVRMYGTDLSTARLISNAFSKSVIMDIAAGKKSVKLSEIIKRSGAYDYIVNSTYAELFDFFYEILVKKYRNEYVYKNAIASKLVVGRHKLSDVSYFSEFNAWDVIADVVVVNGTTTVYEIKTEYDSFSRLAGQLSTYQEVFDRVYTVTPESNLGSLVKLIPENIGIFVLTDRYTLNEYRSAESNVDSLSKRKIFSCLRKNEYERIIVKYFGVLPDVKEAFRRRESIPLFEQLPTDVVHLEFVECLKNRRLDDTSKQVIRAFPKSLVSLGMTANLPPSSLGRLARNLELPVLA